MQIDGATGVVIRAAIVDEPVLFGVSRLAPPVHLSKLRLLGTLRVDGGTLRLTDCSIEVAAAIGPEAIAGGGSRRLSASSAGRALSITGGHVGLTRTEFSGHPAGAISVMGGNASIMLIECVVRNCSASSGGALLIAQGSTATLLRSNLTDNHANTGGALYVRHAKIEGPYRLRR